MYIYMYNTCRGVHVKINLNITSCRLELHVAILSNKELLLEVHLQYTKMVRGSDKPSAKQ